MGCPILTSTNQIDIEYQSTRYSHLLVLRGGIDPIKADNQNTHPQSIFDVYTSPLKSLETIENVDSAHRYGFQGQENDDEIKGKGNSVNYKYRMHDARLGRFFAVDPLTSEYPHYTPYSFSGNKVMHMIELEGLEECPFECKDSKRPKLKRQSSKQVKVTVGEYHYTVIRMNGSGLNKNRVRNSADSFINGTIIISMGSNDDGRMTRRGRIKGGTGNDQLTLSWVNENGQTFISTVTLPAKQQEKQNRQNGSGTPPQLIPFNNGHDRELQLTVTGDLITSQSPGAFGGKVIVASGFETRKNIFGKEKLYNKARAARIEGRQKRKYARKTT